MQTSSSFSSARNSFTPFWHRFPSFFKYPLQLGSIFRIIGYALVGSFSFLLPGFFMIILLILLFVALLKYAFVVMERTANGRFDEPNGSDPQGQGSLVFKQFVVILLYGLVFGLLDYILFEDSEYTIAGIIMSLLLPASIMIIGATHSLAQAIQPGKVAFFIKTIGSPYLAFCAVLIMLTESSGWLQGFLFSILEESSLVVPVMLFIQFYFLVMTYHMMGYVLYQYHDRLGLTADISFEKAQENLNPAKPTDAISNKLATLIAEGKQEEALEVLREAIRTRWEDNTLHERYQKLLLASGKQEQAIQHAKDFITKLTNEKRLFQALDLCESCLKINAEFQLTDSTHVLILAEAAHTAKRHHLALNLMKRFDKRYPNHSQIPAVYMLSARIISEEFRKYPEARQICKAIVSKYPHSPQAAEAEKYLVLLEKLQSAV